MDTKTLIQELSVAMDELADLYRRRDDIVRETNELMIREHNLRAKIERINVDLVSEVHNGTL